MVKFYLVRSDGKITKFYAEGHAKFARHGQDIVCAAVSAISQSTIYGIIGYLKIDAKYFVGKSGFLTLDLEGVDIGDKREHLDVLLETLAMTLKEMEKEYPRNLVVIEKD